MISLIWAQTEDGVIGKENAIPWTLKEDLNFFKQTTINSNILMGSKTFESLNFKPLKDRKNYVLTRNVEKYKDYNFENLTFINSITDLIKEYFRNPHNKLYIIGGSQIYKIFFEYADELIISKIKYPYDGDVKIPKFNFKNFNVYDKIYFDKFIVEKWKR